MFQNAPATQTIRAPDIPFARQGLHVMTKPIGPICNLDCEYCYYLHKEELYPGTKSWRMSSETLEAYLQQYIAAQPPAAREVTFAWQGGEPTLLGLPFFERVVALQRQLCPPGRTIVNTLQTNGVLLNEAWAAFFREHGFLVGLSIDGPAELHDRYRYGKKGESTFAAVLRALQLLRRTGVEFNALVVVHRDNGSHGRRVYTYLRDNGVQYMQFIPVVERRGVGVHAESSAPAGHGAAGPEAFVSSRSVLPEQLGHFLIDVFNEWVVRDVGRVFVQIFDQALAAWLGLEPSLCVFRRRCGRALALEHNGDLYACDHYVEPEYRLGNIHELPIVELANSPRQQAFADAKERTLPTFCRVCEVRFACHGECPKNRFLTTPDGEAGLNYLCAGYRAFFHHIDPAMQLMVEAIRDGRAPASVMPVLQQRAGSRTAGRGAVRSGVSRGDRQPNRANVPRRNALCPCGSGLKYKKCCGAG
jgi:uncharacterized protein